MKDGKRELVINRATRGYVALYRYVAAIDTVFVLAVRVQRGRMGLYWHHDAAENHHHHCRT